MSGDQRPEPGIPEHWLASKKLQAVLFVVTLLYCVSPVDLIPDVVPLIGWLDDMGVILTDIVAFLFYLQHRKREFEQRKPESKPNPNSEA